MKRGKYIRSPFLIVIFLCFNRYLAEESFKWSESIKDAPETFYLNFWHSVVHRPWIAKKDLLLKYLSKIDPRGLQNSLKMRTMIESMDNMVFAFHDNGRILHGVALQPSK